MDKLGLISGISRNNVKEALSIMNEGKTTDVISVEVRPYLGEEKIGLV